MATVILDVAVGLWEPVAQIRTELTQVITFIGVTLIGGLTLTDVGLLLGWTDKK